METTPPTPAPNCCRSPTPSRATRASTRTKCWRRWSRPSRRPAARNTARNTTSAPRSTARSGEIRLLRFREVVDTVENEATQIPLARRPAPQRRGRDRRFHHRPAAAHRFRPHRGADRQAGHRPEGARRRAAAPIQRVQGPRRRDRQRPCQAGRIRQCRRRSRPRRGDAAPRRAAAARELPPGRAGARLYLRRAPGDARPADLPVAHPSAIHGQAVRPGSAGNLRRHHRDQGGGARSRQPRQDRGHLARQRHRPGRRLRRHARQPRAGGGRRAAGREDRHHPVVVRTPRPSSSTRWPRPKSPRW